ncbi:hypothetical protein BU26DRAFT_570717 [Trematosphaeria pertusa]|uniref:Uncharacterized protein n=1 Tax=Trematosphaeria pertusa TaxID=390896 RepID=A0A6A6HWR8_9PLEO|nr:uncharacterized protein BU26DRAFT_570717 [Trematosphaeria pertusa]KAF2242654.1 hypothetical protein BU26DRAFT_570717 [Trematosphaeria pertusa]
MRATYFLSLSFASLVLSSAVKRDCPQSKCYTATNDCGTPYGGCWDECSMTASEVPTFTAPLCSETPAPEITPAPTEPPMSTEGGCSPLTLCIDMMTTCGNQTLLYGGCYDTCTPTTYTPPPCTLPPVTRPGTAPTPMVTKKPKNRKPCKAEKGKNWMCAPPGW